MLYWWWTNTYFFVFMHIWKQKSLKPDNHTWSWEIICCLISCLKYNLQCCLPPLSQFFLGSVMHTLYLFSSSHVLLHAFVIQMMNFNKGRYYPKVVLLHGLLVLVKLCLASLLPWLMGFSFWRWIALFLEKSVIKVIKIIYIYCQVLLHKV